MRRIAALLLFLASCSAHVPEPTESQAGSPESLRELREGRRLYLDKCSACHGLYSVERCSDGEWDAAVDKMIRLKKTKLTVEERDRIVGYLTAMNGRE